MRVVSAVWEFRNLGLSTTEFTVENTDSLEVLRNGLLSDEAEFQVVRVPSNYIHMSYFLQQDEFIFIETLLHLRLAVTKKQQSANVLRALSQVSDREAMANERAQVLQTVSDGLFDTDRISSDPRFSRNDAATRMANWINDELKHGAKLRLVFVRNRSVGFYTWRNEPTGEPVVALSGTFRENTYPGAGMLVNASIVLRARQQGCEFLDFAISSNNLPALRLALSLGFVPTNSLSIFHRLRQIRRGSSTPHLS
jgi:hypothetical protein